VPLVRLHQSLHAAGHRVALPRVERRGEPLTFHLLAPEGPWVRSRYGLDEPGPEVPSLPLPQIDVWVVPGTAFTPAGGRLGRGGGFYDRTLAAARPDAVKVGVCFGCQMFDTLPLAPHDVRMNLVVTERGPLTNATAGCY
jgi:5-formyltetrahydrofolate cyclo-ligase